MREVTYLTESHTILIAPSMENTLEYELLKKSFSM